MTHTATCRVPTCTWSRRCDGSDAADAALCGHLASEHTHRELSDLLVSTWQGRDEGRRGVELESATALDAALGPLVVTQPAPAAPRRNLTAPPARPAPVRPVSGSGESVAQIIEALLRERGPMRASALVACVAEARPGVSRSAVSMTLPRMERLGVVRRLSRGVWAIEEEAR